MNDCHLNVLLLGEGGTVRAKSGLPQWQVGGLLDCKVIREREIKDTTYLYSN